MVAPVVVPARSQKLRVEPHSHFSANAAAQLQIFANGKTDDTV